LSKVDLGRLNDITKRLGEVVLDPAQWSLMMDEICSATSTTGALLLQSDIHSGAPVTDSAREFTASYFANNLHLSDTRAQRGVPLILGGRSVVRDQDIFSGEREMLRDPLYSEANKFGFRWWAAVGFFAGAALWGLGLQRTLHEGPFEESEVKALELLSGRLSEAATLSKVVGRQVLAETTNAFHLIRQPALALDLFGHVLEINSLAERMFGDDLNIKNGRLVARDSKARQELDNIVRMLRITSDTASFPSLPIIIRREDKRPILINIIPVSGAARAPFLGARAILLLNDLDVAYTPQHETLKRVFGLTNAEARLAQIIAVGISLSEAADKLEVNTETVRVQLKSIFVKTGVHRQGELVSLLSRL
jgi:DNA-binding CsgD family transcriptional regulator